MVQRSAARLPTVLRSALGKAWRVNSVCADYNTSPRLRLSAAQGKLKHFDLLLIVSLRPLSRTRSFLTTVKTPVSQPEARGALLCS